LCTCTLLESRQVTFIKRKLIGSEEKKSEIFFKIADAKSDLSGNIFILDSANNSIRKFSERGEFLSEAGKKGQGPGEMQTPLCLDIDQKGNVYVNDYENMRIDIYDNNLRYIDSIRLQKYMSIEDLFITLDGNLLVFRSPRNIGDTYFYLFTPEGSLIEAFFDELHPWAPRMHSTKEIRSYISTFVYLSGKANINSARTRLAFTHEIPENPYKIYLIDMKGKVTSVIKNYIEGYNPKRQQEYFAALLNKSNRTKESGTIITLRDLFFTREDYIIAQRREEIYENGTFRKFLIKLDIFSPDGKRLIEKNDFDGEILSVDEHDNVYARIEDESGISKVGIYLLQIEK
jgi:hypothetical protein